MGNTIAPQTKKEWQDKAKFYGLQKLKQEIRTELVIKYINFFNLFFIFIILFSPEVFALLLR